MTVELERFLTQQKAPEGISEEQVAEFHKWSRFLEEHGLAEYFEDEDGDIDCRITDAGDRLFGALGAAIEFDRLIVMAQIRMGAVFVPVGESDD